MWARLTTTASCSLCLRLLQETSSFQRLDHDIESRCGIIGIGHAACSDPSQDACMQRLLACCTLRHPFELNRMK